MTTREEIQELFNKIAFPETPEERDAAEQAVINWLADAWEEGAEAAIQREHTYGAAEKSKYSNPYTVDAQVDGL